MKQIYFDNAATTQPCQEARSAVLAMMETDYGNPSSMHAKGFAAEQRVRAATETLARLMRVKPKELFYTSGGTESDNWAVFGAAKKHARRGKHIIVSAIEHPAVLAPAGELERQGYEVTRLGTDRFGRIDPEAVRAAVRPDTVLVSTMMVNNEIGTIQPVFAIGEAVKAANPQTLYHVDAVQAFGKLPIFPGQMNIDLLSVSGHKIHGPKGIGFLYMNERARISPLIFGGGQQNDMRSGTDNVPGIVGMAAAAERICGRMEENAEKMAALKARLRSGLMSLEDVVIHADDASRDLQAVPSFTGDPGSGALAVPYILNASFLGIRSEVLLHTLEERGIYVSAGSACSSHKRAGSATLTAIGCGKEEMESAIRFSLCGDNTAEEVDTTLAVLQEVVPQLRRFRRR